MITKKRNRTGDLLAVCPDCDLSFRSYSKNLEIAVFHHKRMGNCSQIHKAKPFDVIDTGDYMDSFKSFSYEDVPLNSLEASTGGLFMLDPVQTVQLVDPKDLIPEINSHPNMYMRRETRSISQQLAGILSLCV